MRRKLEHYMISPVFNRAALNAGNNAMTPAEYRAAVAAGEARILHDMREPVAAIVEKHGGVMVQDGSGFGVEGAAGQFSRYMIVQVPAAAVEALKAVPDVRVERFERNSFKLP